MQTPAIVFRRSDSPSVEEIAVPVLRADEVRIRTHCSGVSLGTERSLFSGQRTENGSFPFVGGYMASGVVEAVGDECVGLKVGQRVVSHTSRLDGDVAAIWGGHAGVQSTHHSLVAPIADELSFEEASMFILPCVAYNAAAVAGISADDTVLIQGAGLIGQMFGQVARMRGARVVMIEPNMTRAELARRCVTQDVLSPGDAAPASVKELLGGQGPSVVVEATGVGSLIDTAAKHLVSGGRFICLAWYPGQVSVTPHEFHRKGATVLFPTGSGGPSVFREVLNAMADGSLVIGDNITDRIPARDAAGAYRRIIRGDDSIMGMTIDWSRL